MTAAADPRASRALLFVVLAAACWGTGTVLSKAAVAELPPLTLLTTQLLVSLVLLGAALWRTGQSLSSVDRRMLLLGALNPGLAYALSLAGLTTITASASVLIWAMEPVLIVLVARVALGERPGGIVVALSVAAFIGLGVAIGMRDGAIATTGVALSLAGVLCCVAYSVGTRRWIAQSPSTLAVVAAQDVVALAVVGLAVVAGLAAGVSPLPTTITLGGVVSAIVSGSLYFGAAYLLYLDALRVLPVSIAAISFYLVPVFGIASTSLSGETLTTAQWAGATATIAAVVAVGSIEIWRARSPNRARARG